MGFCHLGQLGSPRLGPDQVDGSGINLVVVLELRQQIVKPAVEILLPQFLRNACM
jgi:hypothetical protein